MKFELIDYQREAAAEVLKRLARGRNDWCSYGARSAFALSAMTGSGKSVTATAVIEALLFGSADLGVDADPRPTFLWVTDDPALNRQTRNKMLAASDLLSPSQLPDPLDGSRTRIFQRTSTTTASIITGHCASRSTRPRSSTSSATECVPS